MNWLEIIFSPMWLLLDVAMVWLLLVCAFYTRKIYYEFPAPESQALFWGWILIAAIDCGFIAVDCLPSSTMRYYIAEAVVALRIIPIAFLTYGMYGLYKAVRRAVNGKK